MAHEPLWRSVTDEYEEEMEEEDMYCTRCGMYDGHAPTCPNRPHTEAASTTGFTMYPYAAPASLEAIRSELAAENTALRTERDALAARVAALEGERQQFLEAFGFIREWADQARGLAMQRGQGDLAMTMLAIIGCVDSERDAPDPTPQPGGLTPLSAPVDVPEAPAWDGQTIVIRQSEVNGILNTEPLWDLLFGEAQPLPDGDEMDPGILWEGTYNPATGEFGPPIDMQDDDNLPFGWLPGKAH